MHYFVNNSDIIEIQRNHLTRNLAPRPLLLQLLKELLDTIVLIQYRPISKF
jgi:hypothetical protein